jgi:hypothetical protein
MKIINLAIVAVIFCVLCSCDNELKEEPKKEYSNITFTTSYKDIGNVVLGTSKEIEFYAINKSNVPLIIDSVKSSCSCTVSKFPKKPILKNDSGLILARYTPNKTNVGFLEKSIVVLSNTKPAFTVLTFSGTVVVE